MQFHHFLLFILFLVKNKFCPLKTKKYILGRKFVKALVLGSNYHKKPQIDLGRKFVKALVLGFNLLFANFRFSQGFSSPQKVSVGTFWGPPHRFLHA